MGQKNGLRKAKFSLQFNKHILVKRQRLWNLNEPDSSDSFMCDLGSNLVFLKLSFHINTKGIRNLIKVIQKHRYSTQSSCENEQ